MRLISQMTKSRLRYPAYVIGVALAITAGASPNAGASPADQGSAAGPAQAEAQRNPPASPPASAQVPSTAYISPTQFNRIKKALSTSPSVNFDEDRLRFYVQILAKQPNFMEFIKGYDFKNGPTKRGNPMTHQEFLNMVTPKELYSSAGIKAQDLLQFAVTNWLGQALVKRAVEDLSRAKNEREVEEIRERIERELEALRGGGGN